MNEEHTLETWGNLEGMGVCRKGPIGRQRNFFNNIIPNNND